MSVAWSGLAMINGSPPASTVSTYCGAAKAGFGVPLDAPLAIAAPTSSTSASRASLRGSVRFTWFLLLCTRPHRERPLSRSKLAPCSVLRSRGKPSCAVELCCGAAALRVRGEQRADELVERLLV